MKSKSETIDLINQNLPDNTSRAITPSVLRESLINMLGTGSAAILFGKTSDVINYDFEGMAPGAIQTTGDAAPGDGNASIYMNHGTSNPNVAGSIKSADGIWWMFVSKVAGGDGTGGGGGTPSTIPPLMDGIASPGTVVQYSRGDHVHPSDTSRLPLSGGIMTGSLMLNADPSANLEAATRQYVDSISAGKVSRSGDTMTYTLRITNPTLTGTTIANEYAAELILDKPTQTNCSNVWGFTAGSPRWCMSLGNISYESGANAGSHFEIKRFDNAGNHIDSPLYIDRPYGTTQILNKLVIAGNYLGVPSSGDGSASLGFLLLSWPGTAISISPSWVRTAFALEPLRLLPLPRPAGSPFSAARSCRPGRAATKTEIHRHRNFLHKSSTLPSPGL
jgi:hypothetical protein